MKIIDFENKIDEKYKVQKIVEFNELRTYLTYDDSYPKFTPFEVSEGFMENDDFYAAYVFDENEICKNRVRGGANSGWNTTIVFVASIDKVEIDDYFVHTSNGLPEKDYREFLYYIDDLIVSK